MSIFQKIKVILELNKLVKNIKGEANMKGLIKSSSGWLKIIGYVTVALSLAMGLLDAKTAVIITVSISALVKFAEAIVGLTTTTADDEFVNKVKEILSKYNLIKLS